jgi:endonuclease-8
VWLAARNLHSALAGELLTGFDLRVPSFATADLTGEKIIEVVSRGKHLLHRIGDFTLHSHLKMEGAWHLYRPGSPWRRRVFEARAVLETEPWQAVGFALAITELIRRDDEHTVVGHLGPDLLGADWNRGEAITRLSAEPSTRAFIAILDQRNLAGIGNEYANELLFLRGVLPTRSIGDIDVAPLVDLSQRMLQSNRERSIRSTTGDLRPGHTSWVYARAGKSCRRCGTPIRRGTLGPTPLTERLTYWCPCCQR